MVSLTKKKYALLRHLNVNRAPKRRIKQTPPKVKPKLKSLTSNQVRKKIAKGELR